MTQTEIILQLRKQRWLDFYDPDKEPNQLYWIQCYPGLGERPWPNPDRIEARIEWSWRKYQIMLDRLTWLEDDSLPFLDVYTGTELFADAFGCKVHYPADNMPFALPLVHTADEVRRLQTPGLDCAPIARVMRIARELYQRSEGKALLRLPDIQSPMDIAALIWDKESFYPAMLEEPEAVEELAGKVGSLLTAFLDAWFAEFGPEFIAHYPDYYMPCGITLSEDEVGAVSQAMFRRFFLPELSALSLRYGAIGMHCCANSRHQWELFKKIQNLKLLNLIQPAEVIREAYPFFNTSVAHLHFPIYQGPIWTWASQFPAEYRMVFDAPAASREEAVEMIRCIRAND